MVSTIRPTWPALAFMAFAMPGLAQTTGPVVSELSLERQLSLATLLTTSELALPADKLAGILSGSWEVRERLIYNPSGATLTSTIFAAQPGSPLPTPINANLSGLVLGVYTLNV